LSEYLIRLSIVVATKDRYETLFDCIEGLLLNYARDDTEIIVRDNSAQSRIQDLTARFGGRHNLVFLYDPTPVSQSENYELAVARARGEFVIMIGDDDGIAGGLLEIAAWMDRHALDAFLPGTSIYRWPGVAPRYSAINKDGWLSHEAWLAPRLADAEHERRAVLADGCTTLLHMPNLYHGLVRRSCLDRLRAEAGACFPGPSPDMANAFGLSYFVGRMAFAQLPVVISGNSRNSAGGLGLRGMHTGEIADLPFLPRDTAARWNPFIPFCWTGQTIWCQSAYYSAFALGHAQEFEALNNYRALYARVLVFNSSYTRRVRLAFQARHAQDGVLRKGLEGAALVTIVAALWLKRIAGFISRRLPVRWRQETGGLQTSGVTSIVDATRLIDATMVDIELGSWLDSGLQPAVRSEA
jgi:glycosyltransferase involved in cell wall biosynthesis